MYTLVFLLCTLFLTYKFEIGIDRLVEAMKQTKEKKDT